MFPLSNLWLSIRILIIDFALDQMVKWTFAVQSGGVACSQLDSNILSLAKLKKYIFLKNETW